MAWSKPSGGGGTYTQPANSPITLDQNGTTTITHPSVTNHKFQINIFEEVTVTGQTNATIDFDLADEAKYIQEDATNGTDFTVGGTVTLHNSGGAGSDADISANATSVHTLNMTGSADPLADLRNGVTSDTWAVYSNNETNYAVGYVFGETRNFSKFRFFNFATTDRVKDFILEKSIDGGTNWTKIVITGWADGATARNTDEGTASNANAWNTVTFAITTGNAIRARFTSTQTPGGDANAGISELQVFESDPAIYPTTQAYYVTTGDNSQFALSNVSVINSVTITQTTPADTTIKWLVSFDDRTTWKYWDGDSWEVAAGGLADLQTSGNTAAEVQTGLTVLAITNQSHLDFAMDLATTVSGSTPNVSLISIDYDEIPTWGSVAVGNWNSPSGDYIYKQSSATTTIVKKLSATSQKVFINVIT